jgi:hypothetical protein
MGDVIEKADGTLYGDGVNIAARLEGKSAYRRPEDRKRQTTFLRIAAGLEDPGAADALR